MKDKAYLHHIMLLSQKPDLKEMQVIQFDQEVQVCGILNFLFGLLCHASLSFAYVLKIWATFSFFLLFGIKLAVGFGQ